MYFKATLRKFFIPLAEFLLLYAALTAVTTLGSHEWSARHTIFLAIDAGLFLLLKTIQQILCTTKIPIAF